MRSLSSCAQETPLTPGSCTAQRLFAAMRECNYKFGRRRNLFCLSSVGQSIQLAKVSFAAAPESGSARIEEDQLSLNLNGFS